MKKQSGKKPQIKTKQTSATSKRKSLITKEKLNDKNLVKLRKLAQSLLSKEYKSKEELKFREALSVTMLNLEEHIEREVARRTDNKKIENEKLQKRIVLKKKVKNTLTSSEEKYKSLFQNYSINDLTEREKSEHALRVSENRFRTTFYSIGDAVITTDISSNIIDMNPVAEELTGWKESEACGKAIFEIFNIINENTRQRIENPVERVLSEGIVVGLANHTLLISRSGNERPIADSGAPIRTPDMQVIGVVLVFRDKTEERKAKKTLEESELGYRLLFESNPHAMWVYDVTSLKFLAVNNAAIAKYGYSKEEFLSMKLSDIRPHEDESELLKNIAEHKEQIQKSGEWRHKLKDGTIIIVEILSHSLEFDGIRARLILSNDITERSQAEKSLKILSSAIEQTAENVFITSRNGTIEYVNPAFEQLTGYTKEEALGNTPRILKSGKQDKNYYAKLWKTILSGSSFHTEIVNKKKNGGVYYEEKIITPIVDTNGNITHFVSTGKDITNRRKMEEDIVNSERQFRSVWENSFDAMRLCDENGIIIKVNDAFCRIFEMSREKIEGFTYDIAYFQDEHSLEKFKENIETHNIKPMLETEIKLWNNKNIWVELSNSFIEIKNQSPFLLSIFREITERKRWEVELISAKEKAEEMNRLKSNFLANMSHELRTPMIGLLGYAEILKEEIGNPEQKEMIETIHSGGARLLQTLNQLLDLSRIESNKLDIILTQVDLSEIVSKHIKSYERAAIMKNLYLRESKIKENISAILDERIFEQIFNNLLNNALKYTKVGGITVEIDEENTNDNVWAVFRVIDTGIGISEKSMSVIFEEFRQASEGFGRNYEGTGLGLTITKKSIELMKGTISVVSKGGVGSAFTVRLPSSKEDFK